MNTAHKSLILDLMYYIWVMIMCGKQKVTSIRIDLELWKRAKIVAIEEGITLSKLIEEALNAVIGWKFLFNDLSLDIDEEVLKKMIEMRQRGELPFAITSEKTAVEIVKEGRDRCL